MRKGTAKARRFLKLVAKRNELNAIEGAIEVLKEHGDDEIMTRMLQLAEEMTTKAQREYRDAVLEDATAALKTKMEEEIATMWSSEKNCRTDA